MHVGNRLSYGTLFLGRAHLQDHVGPASSRSILRVLGWALSVLACVGTGVALGKTVYVKPNGNDSWNGLTWETAKQTVQAGLNTAVANDQVWVAAGTYVQCITLKAGVALYGGFAGGEDPATFDLADRNFAANETILDGNKLGSVVTSPSGATATTRIDGFTIRNGSGTLVSSYPYGGGIYCSSSSPAIANNTITGNSTSSSYGQGGGIYCYSSSPTIVDNTITGNSARWGGGIRCEDSSSPTIANNAIMGNSAAWGAGIHCHHSSPTIANNTIVGNSASYSGGGILCGSSSPMIASNTITGNSASSGAGISCGASSSPTIANNTIAGNSSSYKGAGISCADGCSLMITNSTITGNLAAYGPALACSSYEESDSSTVTIRNCIVWNGPGWLANVDSSIITITYSNVQGGWPADGNISADPLFVDKDGGDYHLAAGSPCIDAGDNEAVPADTIDLDGDGDVAEKLPFDLDGHPRFMDDPATADTGVPLLPDYPYVVDMGAFEFIPPIPGDFDHDGDVDDDDLAVFQACVSGPAVPYTGDCAKADFDPDGDVDQSDFGLFQVCYSGPHNAADPACMD